jgi:uncharacterized membrane protein
MPARRTFPPATWLVAATLVCATALAIQERIPGNANLDFLWWNLFLAWIPWLFALLAERLHAAGRRARVAFAGCAGAWLLFFPNAPYIVTDLVHLQPDARAPVADAITIAAFAMCGLLLAFASLRRMQALVTERFGGLAGWSLIGVVSLLTGFGVGLGRVLRWNSWDVVSRPEALLVDIATRVSDPLAHERLLGVTVGFSLAFLLWYVCVWRLIEPRLQRAPRV